MPADGVADGVPDAVAQGGLEPGESVLVQGAGGGVATALVALARARRARVYATSRDEAKRERAPSSAPTRVEPGARLPERVDVVIETVGAATWTHSLRSLRPGGILVIAARPADPTPTTPSSTGSSSCSCG